MVQIFVRLQWGLNEGTSIAEYISHVNVNFFYSSQNLKFLRNPLLCMVALVTYGHQQQLRQQQLQLQTVYDKKQRQQ